MSTAVAQSPCTRFFTQVATAKSRVLLVDYDGTVAPFTAERDQAFPYPHVPELLDVIRRICRTRVVIITGRAAREIPPLVGLQPHPEVWGVYGLERLHPDGRYEERFVSEEVAHALAEAVAWLEEEGLQQLCEIKRGAVAVHWRGLGRSHVEEVRTKAYRAVSLLACRPELFLTEFDGGLELRARAGNKGDAVRTILSECPADSAIAYLGDDLSDEDAFRALHGHGLTVLVRPTHRFTAAQLWLRPPEEVVQFLMSWLHACEGDA
ncbi:MAG: trehalose-phosphatase [Terriglobales bacterium]